MIDENFKELEPLIAAMGDKDARARQGATIALGKLDDPQAVDSLIAALHDEAGLERELAAKALQKIGTPEALAAVKKWRDEQKKD